MNATVLKTPTAPALQPSLAMPNWCTHLTALMTNAVEHPTTDEHLALVFSGRGARAAYQVGVLSAVAERFPDLRIDALLPMREVPT